MSSRTTARIRLSVWLLALALLGGVVEAQQQPPDSLASGMVGVVPRSLVERPVKLTDAAGYLHQKVSTESVEAQAYYDQGIAYLASYDWVEAARAFHEALRRDPTIAMAHLGLNTAYFHLEGFAEAREHLRKASDLVSNGKTTPVEAKWIAAASLQREAMGAPRAERATKMEAYRAALDELISANPEDAHAWVRRGMAAERDDGRHTGQDGGVPTIAFHEAALRRDPNHLAAHHYLVHSYENLGMNAPAAEHGRRYAEAVKGVPHAQHMWGHVLPGLGLWAQALEQFAKADRLHRDYIARERIAPADDWHFKHNSLLLGQSHLRLGQQQEAARLLKEVAEIEPRSFFSPYYQTAWGEYLLMQGRFQEALTEGLRLEKGARPLTRALGAILAGEALVGLGRIDEAKLAIRRADETENAILAEARKTENTTAAQLGEGFVKELTEHVEALIKLQGEDLPAAEKTLLNIADSYSRTHNIDAMAAGTFLLQRLADAARRAGRPALAQALTDRIHKLDAGFMIHATGSNPMRN